MARYPRDERISASVSRFCDISGLKPSSVWKMLNQNQLQSITVGRRRLVLLSSYYEFIERQRSGPPLDARRNKTVPAFGSKATVTQLEPRPLAAPDPLDIRVDELAGLSTRAHNVLHINGIDRVGDLVERTKQDLLCMRNFGMRCLGEVEAALGRLNLELRRREERAEPPPFGSTASPSSVRPLDQPFDPPLDTRIEDLPLSTRALNALYCEGIKQVGDLVERTAKDLLVIPNFGRLSLKEVEAALNQLNVKLGSEEAFAAE